MTTVLYRLFTLDFFQSWPVLAVCAVFGFLVCISVILIGMIADQLEKYMGHFLGKLCGPKIAHFIVYRLTLPGTILHELSHAFVGWALGAKILKIRVLEFNGKQLGHVDFRCRGSKPVQLIQLGCLSCAPVITGLIAAGLLLQYGLRPELPWYIILLSFYLLLCVIIHMSMSRQDIKNYLRGLFVIYPAAVGFVYIVRLSVLR